LFAECTAPEAADVAPDVPPMLGRPPDPIDDVTSNEVGLTLEGVIGGPHPEAATDRRRRRLAHRLVQLRGALVGERAFWRHPRHAENLGPAGAWSSNRALRRDQPRPGAVDIGVRAPAAGQVGILQARHPPWVRRPAFELVTDHPSTRQRRPPHRDERRNVLRKRR